MATKPITTQRKTTTAAESTAPARHPTAKRLAAAARPPKVASGFLDFIRGQGVVGIAIGLVVGTQVKDTVNQAVTSFVNPLVGLLVPGSGNLATESFKTHFHHRSASFTYGAFVSSMITFITVAALVYLAITALRLDKLDKKAA
jgi:large-conductance mechanosensitive channel